jgi:hypothetical protein
MTRSPDPADFGFLTSLDALFLVRTVPCFVLMIIPIDIA